MLRFAKISTVVLAVVGLTALSAQAGVLLDLSLDNSTVSGTTVADLSGNGYDGTIVTTNGGVATGQPGAVGEAFGFTGGGVYVTGGPVLTGNVPFTMAFWIKTEDTASKYVMNNEGGGQWAALMNWTGGPGTVALWNLSNLDGANSAISIAQDNTWEHVAWTYDGSSLVKYYNGVQQSTYASSTIANPYANTTWRFGESGLGTGFVGGLDEIKVYDHALSSTEVATLANVVPEPSTLALLGVALIGLLAYAWRKRK